MTVCRGVAPRAAVLCLLRSRREGWEQLGQSRVKASGLLSACQILSLPAVFPSQPLRECQRKACTHLQSSFPYAHPSTP